MSNTKEQAGTFLENNHKDFNYKINDEGTCNLQLTIFEPVGVADSNGQPTDFKPLEVELILDLEFENGKINNSFLDLMNQSTHGMNNLTRNFYQNTVSATEHTHDIMDVAEGIIDKMKEKVENITHNREIIYEAIDSIFENKIENLNEAEKNIVFDNEYFNISIGDIDYSPNDIGDGFDLEVEYQIKSKINNETYTLYANDNGVLLDKSYDELDISEDEEYQEILNDIYSSVSSNLSANNIDSETIKLSKNHISYHIQEVIDNSSDLSKELASDYYHENDELLKERLSVLFDLNDEKTEQIQELFSQHYNTDDDEYLEEIENIMDYFNREEIEGYDFANIYGVGSEGYNRIEDLMHKEVLNQYKEYCEENGIDFSSVHKEEKVEEPEQKQKKSKGFSLSM